MQFLCVIDAGPGFTPDPGYGGRTQPGQYGSVGRVHEAPGYHRIRAAFFRRRIVQERVRARAQDFLRQGRRTAQVAAMEPDLTVLIAAQYFFQPGNIHEIMQAIVDSLFNQWMPGYLPFPCQVVLAGQLVGENHSHQIFRVAALELCGHFLSFVIAPDSEGRGGVPAPVGREHGRRQQCLGNRVPDAAGVQETSHILQGETVGRAQ